MGQFISYVLNVDLARVDMYCGLLFVLMLVTIGAEVHFPVAKLSMKAVNGVLSSIRITVSLH